MNWKDILTIVLGIWGACVIVIMLKAAHRAQKNREARRRIAKLQVVTSACDEQERREA